MTPYAPARACTQQGCPHVVMHDKPCPVHGAATTGYRWGTDRRQDVVRLRGRANQERRRRLFAREPLCRTCAQQGRVTIASIADHAIPLAEGGRDDETNLVPICAECHKVKIQAESRRGQKRAR